MQKNKTLLRIAKILVDSEAAPCGQQAGLGSCLRRWKLLNKFLRTDTDTDNSDKDTKKLENCGTKVLQALLAKKTLAERQRNTSFPQLA